MFEDFEFGATVLEKYIDFDFESDASLEDQVLLLKEDILQVTYKNGLILDVGWYPEFDLKGCFTVRIIRNGDWEKPIRQTNCVDVDALYSCVVSYVEFISAFAPVE